MTEQDSAIRKPLFCTLCKENLVMSQLERHYLGIHVGTYSPFAWIEQFVIFASGSNVRVFELREKIKKRNKDLEKSNRAEPLASTQARIHENELWLVELSQLPLPKE